MKDINLAHVFPVEPQPIEPILYTYMDFKKCQLLNIKKEDITKKTVVPINHITDAHSIKKCGILCFKPVGIK